MEIYQSQKSNRINKLPFAWLWSHDENSFVIQTFIVKALNIFLEASLDEIF